MIIIISRRQVALMAVRVTRLLGGGTAVAVLLQHGLCDAEASFQLVAAWARTYR